MLTRSSKGPGIWIVTLALFVALHVPFSAVGAPASNTSSSRSSSTVMGRSGIAPPLLEVSTGQATWYGKKHHGRKTANGERYDKRVFTAAHKTLPFGTIVRVTNLRNNREAVVRITDRGPFGKGKIIDLAQVAAAKINMMRAGVVPVQVEVLTDPSGRISQPGMGFYVALEDPASHGKLARQNATQAKRQAEHTQAALPKKVRNKVKELKVLTEAWPDKRPNHFAGLGPFKSYAEASRIADQLRPHVANAAVRCLPLQPGGSTQNRAIAATSTTPAKKRATSDKSRTRR